MSTNVLNWLRNWTRGLVRWWRAKPEPLQPGACSPADPKSTLHRPGIAYYAQRLADRYESLG